MELVYKSDRLKELHRVGADVDAGAELGEFGRLLVDLHLETLPAQRDGRRQAAEAGSDNGNATRSPHLALRNRNDSREGLISPSLPIGPSQSAFAAVAYPIGSNEPFGGADSGFEIQVNLHARCVACGSWPSKPHLDKGVGSGRKIIEAASLGIGYLNNQQRRHVSNAPKTVLNLAAMPHIIAVKRRGAFAHYGMSPVPRGRASVLQT